MTLPILITGAGPTGLALAASFTKAKIPFRLIDSAEKRSHQTKALAVQAGTLEALADVFGPAVPEMFTAKGLPARAVEIFFHPGRPPVSIDFSTVESRFNFILMLPQWETEAILESLIGNNSIDRGWALRAHRERDGHVECELEHQDGRRETMQARYLVGCDGAHSIVRKNSDISFKGETYHGDFWLGDTDISWPIPSEDRLLIFLGAEGGVAAFFPMGPKTSRYRGVIAAFDGQSAENDSLSLEDYQAGARRISGVDMTMSNPQWITRFRLNDRIAGRFQQGRIFLAGDAAHIHTPAGGQGMNTGIQDALALGFKIAKVVNDGAPEEFLETYGQERRPVAEQVLRFTGRLFQAASVGRNPLLRALRSAVAPRLLSHQFLRQKMITTISQIETARRDIAIRADDK